MAEKKVSVRLAAVGGKELKGEFVAIGAAAKDALAGIGANSNSAEAGMNSVEAAAERARRSFEELSVKAANSAAAMRTTAAAASPMVDQINRLTGVTPAIGQTTAEYLQQGQALDQLRAKYNPVYAAIQRYRNTVSEVKSAHLQGAISAQEMAAAIQRERRVTLDSIAAIKGRTTAIMGMSQATGVARFRTQQMFFQLNDIGVSLAGGMNPFVVMAQQGTQIAQIYGFGNGGVGAALRDVSGLVSGLVRRFWPVAAAVGAVSAVIGGLTREINNTTDATVTFGDTAKAIWQTVISGLDTLLRPAIEAISEWFWTAWDWAVDATVSAVNSIINNAKILVLGIKTAMDTVPDYFRAAFSLAVSYVITKMHDMVWYVGQAVNGIAEGLNSVFNTDLSTDNFSGILDMLSQKSGEASEAATAAANRATAAWGEFGAKAQEIANENPMGELFDTIRDRAIENSLNRISDGLDKVGGSARRAGEQVKEGMDQIKQSLADYAREAQDTGKGLSDALTNGFKSAESAFRKFTETGKFDFRGLVQSIIADLATLTFKAGVLGPLAEWLSGAIGSGGGFLGTLFGSIMHDGGVVGAGGPQRAVPAAAFAGAERFHGGGWPGLRPDEVPVIAQRGERIWSRREVAQGMAQSRRTDGAVDVRIMMEDGNLVPVIERVSGRVAARVTSAGMQTVQRNFGNSLDNHFARRD
ncbi:lambda phage tail tape-measure protein [Ruegeria lacuscaerulensis ITI-1157]|nr:lambda phage tail tape-measure protein [Ruegeria lacuscaerulensis ITI-1157]SHK05837.1 phage tail tape measure protein, lambda family [Ruegeria lacuscaerulensis ITI-1157]